jgi:hypothetical protein
MAVYLSTYGGIVLAICRIVFDTLYAYRSFGYIRTTNILFTSILGFIV